MVEEFEIFQPTKEVEVNKPKAPNYLFEFLKNISQKKENILNEETKKSYSPYIINRYLSMHQGTILYAQEMNIRPSISSEMHYEYLINAVRPMYRRFEYKKAEKDHDDILLLSKYYECSITKARDYFKLHTIEEILSIASKYNEGGKNVKTRREKTKHK
jgi:hypothetical protein